MLQALQKLGVHWSRTGFDNEYIVTGTKGELPVRKADLVLWGMRGTATGPLWQPHWQF